MNDIMILAYPWTKALHIISVISWLVGMFYLPRLFVYHVEKANDKPEIAAVFQEMEYKLLKIIMNPAMISSWIFGLLLAFTPGVIDWGSVWPYVKAAAVIGMTGFHHWLSMRSKDFVNGQNKLSGSQYRMLNEVTTILMIVIVLAAVVKF
ncbi:MAG: protoporphyrinogen oxidase HemJ [Roseovarius sp.]|nr:protoporphyrinogen oxidase HemJ [Roseovarius sp.]MCY4316218.1 protoporphyrinogen oxidase HemJ [Roseovarius sp.]